MLRLTVRHNMISMQVQCDTINLYNIPDLDSLTVCCRSFENHFSNQFKRLIKPEVQDKSTVSTFLRGFLKK